MLLINTDTAQRGCSPIQCQSLLSISHWAVAPESGRVRTPSPLRQISHHQVKSSLLCLRYFESYGIAARTLIGPQATLLSSQPATAHEI